MAAGGRAGWPILQKSAQVVGQLLSRPVPLFRFLRHRLEYDRLQVGWNRRVDPPRTNRLDLRDLLEHVQVIKTIECRSQNEQFVKGGAQRIDVGPMIDDSPGTGGLLGAHVT